MILLGLILVLGFSQEELKENVLTLNDKPVGFGEATTGGAGGKIVTVDNIGDFKKYAQAQEPYIILVKGVIDTSKETGQVNIASNKTIIGITPDASIIGWGLYLKGVNNVIIRNLTIKNKVENPKNDAINIEASQNI